RAKQISNALFVVAGFGAAGGEELWARQLGAWSYLSEAHAQRGFEVLLNEARTALAQMGDEAVADDNLTAADWEDGGGRASIDVWALTTAAADDNSKHDNARKARNACRRDLPKTTKNVRTQRLAPRGRCACERPKNAPLASANRDASGPQRPTESTVGP